MKKLIVPSLMSIIISSTCFGMELPVRGSSYQLNNETYQVIDSSRTIDTNQITGQTATTNLLKLQRPSFQWIGITWTRKYVEMEEKEGTINPKVLSQQSSKIKSHTSYTWPAKGIIGTSIIGAGIALGYLYSQFMSK